MTDQTPNKTEGSKKKLDSEATKELCIDFIVNDLTPSEIIKKYEITQTGFVDIRKRMSLDQKKETYQKNVLSKALKKCEDQHANILVKITGMLEKHVNAVAEKQINNKTNILSDQAMRHLLPLYSLISKEDRLNKEKPTDLREIKVNVQLPEALKIFGSTKKDARLNSSKKEVIDVKATEPAEVPVEKS